MVFERFGASRRAPERRTAGVSRLVVPPEG
jgi:hypothetical protein